MISHFADFTNFNGWKEGRQGLHVECFLAFDFVFIFFQYGVSVSQRTLGYSKSSMLIKFKNESNLWKFKNERICHEKIQKLNQVYGNWINFEGAFHTSLSFHPVGEVYRVLYLM